MTRNGRTALLAAIMTVSMGGLAYASVPLYRIFCQATGLNGTTQGAEGERAPGAVVGKLISVRFDANVSPDLPWKFVPEHPTQRVAVGARELTFFEATNLSDKPLTGSATFNVTPGQAGQYFTKIQCFCFTDQTLRPGETMRMPVVFYVDPALIGNPDTANISEITLSYTFFPVKATQNDSAVRAPKDDS